MAILGMPRSGIREIFDLASTIPEAIHLEMGEPNFDTPEHILEAAADGAARGYTKYTPNAGLLELREALAAKVRDRNGIRAEPEQVVVTPGAIAALYGTLLALCDPGDEVLVADPAWPNYRMIADLQGLRAVRYPLGEGMLPEVETIEPLITPRTKVLLLNSPCNPTGVVIGEDRLRGLAELAAAHDLWVVSDEVYDEMVFDGGVAPSLAALGWADRVISVFSFSKTYAMTGWRVGYAVAPPDLAPLIVKTQEPITACVNGPAQVAALAAVQGPQDCVGVMRDAYAERRDRAVAILSDAGVPYVRPSGAFYLWVDVSASGVDSTGFARRLLTERGVAVTPGVAFGPGSDGYVRVSLASAPEALLEGVRRIAEEISG